MALNPSPSFNPNDRIPNNPFYSQPSWTITGNQGPLITGSGLLINANTGIIQAAAGPNPPGTVTNVTAGTGIVTSPVTGITGAGSVSLATVAGLTPGTYVYATVTVDMYGRVVIAQDSVVPVQSVTGVFPILVSGSNQSPFIDIAPGNTTQPGAVRLRDDCNTPSDTLALTANQGVVLQGQINVLSSVLGNQFLAGTLNAFNGDVVTATIAGNLAGVTAGNPLPAPAPGNLGADVVVTTGGTYTPPGGGGPYSTVAGDKFISTGTSWEFLRVGFRAPYATTTFSGVVELADAAETQALIDSTRAVTPAGLGTLNATTTDRGLVELATDAETLVLTANNVVVTPSNLGALQASSSQRGLVRLASVLGTGSTTLAPTAALLDQIAAGALSSSIINAIGDLIVGQAPDTPAILPRGTNGSVLTVDVTSPVGLAWNVPNSPDSVPVGGVIWFTTDDPAKLPFGYEVCDGGSYSALPEISPGVPNPYYDLFTVIGYLYGGGGATFNVPDLQGMFVRGLDSSGSVDPGRTIGSVQQDAFAQHAHTTQPHTHTSSPHTHTANSHTHTTQAHTHTSQAHTHTTQPHTHTVDPANFEISTAAITGNDNGLYRGNRGFGFLPPTTDSTAPWTTDSATVTVDNATNVNNNATVTVDGTTVTLQNTTVSIANATVTVDNAPLVAPTPDETRPKNVALVPLIKYTNVP